MNEKNFLSNMRKIGSGEKGGITTTDDGDGLVLIKSAVTSGTIGNAMADELGFIDKIEATWGGAGSEDDGFGSIGLIAGQGEMGGSLFKMLNLVVGERKTEGL